MDTQHNHNYKHINQAGFFSLEIIALLIFLLFITGVGQAMWRHSLRLGDYCRDAVGAVSLYDLYPTCTAISKTMMEAQYHVDKVLGAAGYAEGMSQTDLLNEMTDYFHLSLVGLNGESLKQYMNPAMLQDGFNAVGNGLKEMQYAVTQGNMGSNLFAKGDVSGGMGYMRNAANMGDYGLMSQLQLGSIYGGGLGGVTQDLGAANYYHRQAYQSLQRLQANPAPAAKQILSTLPVQPQQLMQQLAQVLKVQ
jgi:hypothetical protein